MVECMFGRSGCGCANILVGGGGSHQGLVVVDWVT